jgi:hypothetical protein
MGFVTVEDENGLAWAVPDGFGGTHLVYFSRKLGADGGQSSDDLRKSDNIAVEALDAGAESPGARRSGPGIVRCAHSGPLGGAE